MIETIAVAFRLNGADTAMQVPPDMRLIDILRERLGLTAAKKACGIGRCGACAVLVDERPVNACLLMAWQIVGADILTPEGLDALPEAAIIRSALAEENAFQCGYCAPGFTIALTALLREHLDADEPAIRAALEGNICRCTGYHSIIRGALAPSGQWRTAALRHPLRAENGIQAMTIAIRNSDPRHESVKAFLARPRLQHLIGGRWYDASDGATMPATDPASGRLLAKLAQGTAEDADRAVAAARCAFESDPWCGMTSSARGKLLWRIGEAIDRQADELAELETLDQGKSLKTARFGEIPAAAEQFRYFAGFATKILGTTIPTSISHQPVGKKIFAYTTREPIGVVAAITPWNSPLLMAAMKLAPALAAGCTVVLKPAEETSLTALRLGELMIEAGLPAGVVNIVTGPGETVGAALAAHPGIDKVAFTGSTEVGKLIVVAASGNLKKLTLELGGKSPAIVMPDADMELAIPGIARSIFANAGQVCVAGSRVYAHRSICEKLIEGLAAEAKKLRLGHGLDPDTDLGPLVNAVQAERVAAFVAEGEQAGADIVVGGKRTGTFFEPTVVTSVRPQMRMMREEIFGPVVAVTPFDELDEAVAFANDSPYGLAASLWTRDLSTAHRLSARIRSGTVWINCHSYFSPELPKGGHKQSGWGYENGAPGLENYLETKTVCALV